MPLTALVTGATDGIGRAAALELARCGYTVHALGRDARRGEEILAELRAISQARVVHVAGTTLSSNIPYDRLSDPRLGVLRATSLAITADTFLVHYLHELALTPVPHEMVTPGVVNTRQVRERPWPLRLIVSLFGMIEPDEAGQRLVRHIRETDAAEMAGRAFHLEKPRKVDLGRGDPLEKCRKLIAFTESFTGVKVWDYLAPASPPPELASRQEG